MSNTIVIAGIIGKDAEVKFLQNGDAVSNFSLADSQGSEKPTIWHNCTIFGKRAESLSPYLLKGQFVTVFGQQTMREYVDKDGIKKQYLSVRVGDITLQGGKKTNETSQRQAPSQATRPAPNFSDMDDDDIPF